MLEAELIPFEFGRSWALPGVGGHLRAWASVIDCTAGGRVMFSEPRQSRARSAEIADFLKCKRIAAIGVSRNPQDFTRKLMEEFEKNGYEIVPVNPAVEEIGGKKSFAKIQDVNPPVSAALVLTPAAKSEQVVRDCASAGVAKVWLYGTNNLKGVNPAAVQFCREKHMSVIPGECPFMFFSNAGFPHRVHRLITKVIGTYPK
jgi:predicted CoA-binding protein